MIFPLFIIILSPLAQISGTAQTNSSITVQTHERLVPLLIPPDGWKCARPTNPSPYVQLGFIGKSSTPFHPTINVAIEDVDISQKEYVKAVKEVHLSEPGKTWRDLGKFSMKAGVGTLTEISHSSPYGEIRTLQVLLVKGKTAYITTATALKKEYPELQKEILQSFQSLSLHPDLIAALPDKTRQKELQQLFASLGNFSPKEDLDRSQKLQWEQLQKEIIEKSPEMGVHWQFLVLEEGYRKIYPH